MTVDTKSKQMPALPNLELDLCNIRYVSGAKARDSQGLKLAPKIINNVAVNSDFVEMAHLAPPLSNEYPKTNKLNISPSLVICPENMSAKYETARVRTWAFRFLGDVLKNFINPLAVIAI
jgi:hypothetical protein